MLFETLTNLSRSSVTDIILAVEQAMKKSKKYKTKIAKINLREKYTGSHCTKLSPREMLKNDSRKKVHAKISLLKVIFELFHSF